MSGHLVIVAATIDHVYELARNLREEDRAELLGADARKVIRKSWRMSILRRTALVDGDVAAMWGLGGTILSDDGEVWLMTTPAIERAPVAFLRGARDEVGRMLRFKSRLSGVVGANYRRAIRFLEALGFSVGERLPNAEHLRRFTMVA